MGFTNFLIKTDGYYWDISSSTLNIPTRYRKKSAIPHLCLRKVFVSIPKSSPHEWVSILPLTSWINSYLVLLITEEKATTLFPMYIKWAAKTSQKRGIPLESSQNPSLGVFSFFERDIERENLKQTQPPTWAPLRKAWSHDPEILSWAKIKSQSPRCPLFRHSLVTCYSFPLCFHPANAEHHYLPLEWSPVWLP